MMTVSPSDDRTLNEVRIQAARLLKAARRGDTEATARLSGQLKHRHALNIVAQDLAGLTYQALRAHCHSGAGPRPELFFTGGLCAHWNHWFAHYADALEHLRANGGFLFPYRNQFVVLDADAMRTLALDPDDPDWAAIAFDWARPADAAAFVRLSDQLCAAGYGTAAA